MYQQGEDEEELAAGAHDAEEPEEEGSGEKAQLDPVEVREREHEDLVKTWHEEEEAHA